MRSSFFPINNKVFSDAFHLLADAWSATSFAPSHPAGVGTAAPPHERVSLWERLDRWAWKQVQKEREAYLAKAQDLVDLENRIRHLESVGGRFY